MSASLIDIDLDLPPEALGLPEVDLGLPWSVGVDLDDEFDEIPKKESSVIKTTFHNVEQNTDEWLDLRAGLINSSSLSCIMANYGKAFGDPAKEYAADIAATQLAGKRFPYHGFKGKHMERGHEQEPFARRAYELEEFATVSEGGFFENGIIGSSPDGLVDDDGAIEIKSVIPKVQFKTLKRGSFDPAYRWQLSCNLKMTERDWIDYVSYCHDFVGTGLEGKSLFIFRLERDSEKVQKDFEMIDLRVSEFLDLIEESKKILR